MERARQTGRRPDAALDHRGSDAGGSRAARREEDGYHRNLWRGGNGATKIAVKAPPLEGRANLALIAFLAESLGVAKNAVELKAGELSRSKVFLLRGVTLEKAEAALLR